MAMEFCKHDYYQRWGMNLSWAATTTTLPDNDSNGLRKKTLNVHLVIHRLHTFTLFDEEAGFIGTRRPRKHSSESHDISLPFPIVHGEHGIQAQLIRPALITLNVHPSFHTHMVEVILWYASGAAILAAEEGAEEFEVTSEIPITTTKFVVPLDPEDWDDDWLDDMDFDEPVHEEAVEMKAAMRHVESCRAVEGLGECAVCLDSLFVCGESTAVMKIASCSHVFHSSCILRCLESGNYSCPLCRFDLIS